MYHLRLKRIALAVHCLVYALPWAYLVTTLNVAVDVDSCIKVVPREARWHNDILVASDSRRDIRRLDIIDSCEIVLERKNVYRVGLELPVPLSTPSAPSEQLWTSKT